MMRRFWLLKSDPATFGWSDLVKSPGRKTVWDGIRNYQARNTLRDDVKKGDGILFYHSQAEKAVVGTCRVTRAGFPDPQDGSWTAIEIAAEDELAKPVALADLRKVPQLAKMALLQNSRLSVQPVTEAEWEMVLKLGRG